MCVGQYLAALDAQGHYNFRIWGYRERKFIERDFNRLKQICGLATRYDRRVDNFLADIKVIHGSHVWEHST